MLPSLLWSEVTCPKSIASIEKSRTSESALVIFKQIYSDLGCSTEFKSLPGRRGFKMFNSGLIDGELFRLEIAFENYSAPFIKSSIPVFSFYGSLWGNPNRENNNKLPTGTVIGIFWHENFDNSHINTIRFNNSKDMIKAYNLGLIGQFLASKYDVVNYVKLEELEYEPVFVENIVDIPLFHILNTEYEDFMDIFSEILKKEDPFSTLEVNP